MSDDQRGQLGIRCYREYQDVLYDIEHGPMFFPRAKARGLTQANPKFDGYTAFSTSLPKLLDASDAVAVAVCHHYQNGFVKSKTKSWSSFIKENPEKVRKVIGQRV